jgi:hypothetical protein
MITFIVMVFVGLFGGLGYGIYQAGECKKLAIANNNMHYLEIKDLCQ